jgi:glycerol-3-phosphate dehydrogenase
MGGEAVSDLLIVGGGVNGCGIARDATGRGLSVTLCEQDDLASGTSSRSTKLIHGGLRYLEYYEFRLVREALIEREVLLAQAPHIIWPLRFVLPHDSGQRPAWMIRLGLFLYDHLGGRKVLPASKGLALRQVPAGRPLKPDVTRGFEYSDCWVEDSRLVVLNAVDAATRGARILTRTRCVAVHRDGDVWRARLADVETGAETKVAARALVNAAGPWVSEVLGDVAGVRSKAGARLVKGSHIVVPRLHDGAEAYILQNEDRRIVFVIPYEHDYSLIGTTDVEYLGDPKAVAISDEEIAYLCRSSNRYFTKQIAPADVVWSYSGVRSLYNDGADSASEATRDYVLELDHAPGTPPLLSVFGGKITTFRRLAEHALDKLLPAMALPGAQGAKRVPWTARSTLPGGDIAGGDFERFLADLAARHPWLPPALARRLARAYGTRVALLIGPARDLAALGRDFGAGLTEAEVRYLMAEEWARTADDVLWRRSKLGLRLDAAQARALGDWMDGCRQTRALAEAGGAG